jgi:hypothetical protein
MRFYKQPLDQEPHRFYCGVDLHARCMYLCILDAAGNTILHKDYLAASWRATNPFPEFLIPQGFHPRGRDSIPVAGPPRPILSRRDSITRRRPHRWPPATLPAAGDVIPSG